MNDPSLPQRSPSDLVERIAAERLGDPFLELADGDGRWRLIALAGSRRLTIGRDEGADLALSWDREVSRIHAVLEMIGSSWTVTDEGLSRNGTFVNGKRATGTRRIVEGDQLRVGRSLIVFRDPTATRDETAPASEMEEIVEITPAQRRVLVALARPYAEPGWIAAPASNREVAEELVLSVEGVRTHIKALFSRLGVPDAPPNRKRAELVRRAFALGLIDLRDLRDSGG